MFLRKRYKSIIGSDYDITDVEAERVWAETCLKAFINPVSMVVLIVGILISLYFLEGRQDVILLEYFSVKKLIEYIYVYVYLVVVDLIRVRKFKSILKVKKITNYGVGRT